MRYILENCARIWVALRCLMFEGQFRQAQSNPNRNQFQLCCYCCITPSSPPILHTHKKKRKTERRKRRRRGKEPSHTQWWKFGQLFCCFSCSDIICTTFFLLIDNASFLFLLGSRRETSYCQSKRTSFALRLLMESVK